jgi:hypothetical protein
MEELEKANKILQTCVIVSFMLNTIVILLSIIYLL